MSARTGSKSWVLSALLVLFGVWIAARTAWAREATPILPGQRAYVELGVGASMPVALQCTAGMKLKVDLVAWRGENVIPDLTVTDPDGEPVSILYYARQTRSGRRFTVAGLPIVKTGVYRLTVTAQGTSSGGLDVRTSASRKKASSGRATLPAPGSPAEIRFPALPGDRVSLSVTPKSATIQQLVYPSGFAIAVERRATSGTHRLGDHGEYRFEVIGVGASVSYKLKLIPVKAPKPWVDLADLTATGSISGRIIVEGSPALPAAKAKNKAGARPRRARAEVRSGELIVSLPGSRTPAEVVRAAEAAVPGTRFVHIHSMTEAGPHLLRTVGTMLGKSRRRDQGRTRAMAKAAALSQQFNWVEPNGVQRPLKEPNDALWSDQDDFRTLGLPGAWNVTTGAPTVVVAVVDTGIWPSHPDLAGRLLPGYDFVGDVTNSSDGDGWDFDPTDAARDFHGTHVAGTIGAAGNNRIGVVGVMWDARIVPVRVLGKQGGTAYDIAAGIRWAAGLPVSGVATNQNPARVINLSLGGRVGEEVERSAVEAVIAANVVVIAAAGNDDTDQRFYPAAFPGVIAVSAIAPDLSPASYSNYGTWIGVSAPGGDLNAGLPGILSTYVDDKRLTSTYKEEQGTSMACPHVAGIAGLMLSIAPTLKPAQVKSLLESTAIDLGDPGFDIYYGAGLVDAEAVVRAASGVANPSPILSVTPNVLELGPGTSEATIYVRNNGTGSITLGTVTTATDGGAWLSASRSDTQAPTTVKVAVDRGLLSSGLHVGTVVIPTSAGTATIPVRVLRSDPVDIGAVRVAAVDAQGQLRAATDATFDAGYSYTLSDLPAGDYELRAWIDKDSDLVIGRVDEWWGMWPLASAPGNVSLSWEDLDRSGHDFAVERRDAIYQYSGAGGGPIQGAVAVRVTDSGTGEAIPNAALYVGSGVYSATTDWRGRAVVTAPINGGQTITIAANGYGTQTQVGSNAQYQSFSMLPLASLQPTGTATVSVFVDGLAYTDYFVVIQVGDAFEVATHDGYDGYVVADLAVPVTAGELPVWAVVYDEDGAPVKVALDTVEGLGSGDYLDVYLEAYQPHTYYWTQSNRVVSLPTSSFTKSGAELYVESNIYWDAQLTLNIGVDSLTPSVGGTVSWISFGTTDPSLSANTHVYALDTAGRASAHFTYGTVNTIGVPDYVTLKSPPALLSPAANQTVPVSGLGFSFTAAAGAQLHALSLTDAVTGDSTWTVWVPGGSSSIVLPQIPTGGLVRGRAYDWNVSSYFLPGFDLDSYLDDAFLLGITDSCSSENRRLTAQ